MLNLISLVNPILTFILPILPLNTAGQTIINAVVRVTVEAVITFTGEEFKDLSNEAKRTATIKWVRATVDASFDIIPEWRDLREERRDKLIDGIIVWALYINKLVLDSEKAKAKRRNELGHKASI